MYRAKDIAGLRISRFTVVRRHGTNRYNKATWLCVCECGTEKVVAGSYLLSGSIRSCGCLSRESVIKTHTTHGKSKHPLYPVWAQMFQRCENKKNKKYKDYGGRGIRVCKRWENFEHFLADMGERPIWHALDRIDCGKGYSPSNCRWATYKQQNRNRRKTLRVTYQGRETSISDLADKFGLSYDTVRTRLELGWPAHRLTEPPRKRKKTRIHL